MSLYSKQLPTFFQQHGIGSKHNRPIILQKWQQRIVDAYPLDFWRGLYHSDGSRYSNVVDGKDYPRYQFTNRSDDIRQLFKDACDQLGLEWTVNRRTKIADAQELDVFVSKRKDVQFLDDHIGPKR